MARFDFERKGLVDALKEIESRGRLSDEAKNRLKDQVAEQYYQQGPDLKTFETMLNKLTGAKMAQQGQIASARRGDIYAGGLANMMSNF